MIKVNGNKIIIERFPDGTPRIRFADNVLHEKRDNHIAWFYEDDTEIVSLFYIAEQIKDYGYQLGELYMPYIPNARMDRIKPKQKECFTLKHFCKLLNSIGFKRVCTIDAHSDVSLALINKIDNENIASYLNEAITRINQDDLILYYPDKGASKRYSELFDLPYIYGEKDRDFKTGRINGLKLKNNGQDITGKSILMIDDICSKGGTLYYSAKKLKEEGASNIYAFITHCENTIHKGELLTFGLIDKIYTTHSILTKSDSLIEVIEL